MKEIFISYAKGDRSRAAELAALLEAQEWRVWWDRQIPPGRTFDEVIEEALTRAACVIVLWSAESVASRWVRSEASAAAERSVLIPALIENVAIPLEFRRMQAANLVDWSGDAESEDVRALLDTVRQYVGAGSTASAAASRPIGRPPAWRRRARLLAVIGACAVAAALIVWGFLSSWNRAALGTDARGSAPTEAAANPDPLANPASPNPAPADRRASPEVGSAPAGSFLIKIGETVSDGKPKAGAGEIGEPFEQDIYVFAAAPRQRVYFRPLEQSAGMGDLHWRLVDSREMVVFDGWIAQEPGVQTLVRGGTYTLTVGSKESRGTGLYSFRLYNVPAAEQFQIRIGSKVSDGVPAAGAGYIESPGAHDVYSFSAAPRQKVQFRPLKHSARMGNIGWRLADDDGVEIFSTWLPYDPGVQTLTKGGRYTLTVGNPRVAEVGTYEFELVEVR